MREVDVSEIKEVVKKMCIESNLYLGEDVLKAFDEGLSKEESPAGKDVLEQLIENAKIAKENDVPMCQDTGYTVIFLELGQEVKLTGGDLTEAIDQGVREGYDEGYLRKSVVKDPLDRVNTGDNTPAIVYTDIVPGDQIKIKMAPKGGGAENMSDLKMLKPADGREGVIDFVVEAVSKAGPNPCPPIVVGVGVGGTFEKVAYLAKKALLRPVGDSNPEKEYAEMEEEMLERINKLGIGPQGFGGRVTALDVHIEKHPAHIASMPVAVNINCHAARHMEKII